MLNVSVVIPTYRRPIDLARCLAALKKQNRRSDEVLVIVRDTDVETWEFLREFDASDLPLQHVTVTISGQIAALNAGLCAVKGDIVAITDDDAAPHPDWLERIEAHFLADDRIGGVGGRDVLQYPQPWDMEPRDIVGKLRWYGKVLGDHHRGVGSAREVDVLKGVNMSYRRSALMDHAFDLRLLGTGAQVHNEVAFCLPLRKKGWTLIYDPAILVDHYTASRFDEDQRDQFNAIAFSNAVHNETLALLEHFAPAQRIVFLIWAIGIGTTASVGVLQWLRYLPSLGVRLVTQKWLASLRGRYQGVLTWLRSADSSPSACPSCTKV